MCPKPSLSKWDGVNTAIMHLYSTLPHNGRIQQKSVIKRIGKIQVDTKRCLNKSAKAEQKPNRLVWKTKVGLAMPNAEVSKADCLKSSLCSTQSDQYLLKPIRFLNDRNRSAKRYLVISSAMLSVVGIFSRPSLLVVTHYRMKWYGMSICFEALWWSRFFDKATTPWLSLY